MRHNNFNGLIKEICEQYPNIDLPGYLADNLQLTLDKTEVLAERIEKQILQKTSTGTKQKILHVLEKTSEKEPPNSCNYHVDCLTPKEFEYFIKWLLGELGYEAQPEMYSTTEWGIDVVASKEGEKVVVQAVRCPKTYRVTETAIRLMHEIRGDCQKALVITTAYFTEQAQTAAERTSIELWNIDTLNQKIAEAREHIELEVQTNFPKYKGSLLHSLLALEEPKTFLIETKAEGKYDLHLPGVKYPLLTFQAQNGIVTRCILRIKYNEPISEDKGEVVIGFDETNLPFGPPDEEAYGLVTQYLEQFLE